MPAFPWLDLANVITQGFIALAVGALAWRQHSTTVKIQQMYKVHEWGRTCLDILSECEHFCRLKPNGCSEKDFHLRRGDILARLSSLINRGRLFYGNVHKKEYGQSKYPAHQGYRPVILDPLVAAYRILDGLDDANVLPDIHRGLRLEEWRKFFLSLLQEDVSSEWLKRQTDYDSMVKGIPGYHINENSEPPSWGQYKDYQDQMKS